MVLLKTTSKIGLLSLLLQLLVPEKITIALMVLHLPTLAHGTPSSASLVILALTEKLRSEYRPILFLPIVSEVMELPTMVQLMI